MFEQSKKRGIIYKFCLYMILFSASLFGQNNPYSDYSLSQINAFIEAIAASRMDIVHRGAVSEMLAINQAEKQLLIVLFTKRSRYLQQDIPDEADNPFLSRRKILACIAQSQGGEDLYQLEEEISAEISQLYTYLGEWRPYADACIRSLQDFLPLIYSKYSFGELNSRLDSINSSRMDIVHRGAVSEMLAANIVAKQLKTAFLIKRNDCLQKNLQDDPNNPYLTRRKFFSYMKKARNWQELFQLNDVITQEILKIDGCNPAGRQCISSLQSLRALIPDEIQKRFPADRTKYQDACGQASEQEVQVANAIFENMSATLLQSMNQQTSFQVDSQNSSSQPAKQKRIKSQGYCSIHQCTYTYGIGMAGGCPKCNTAKYGLQNYYTCPKCHQPCDSTFGHPNCK